MILVALLISPACPAVAEDALPAPLVHPPANDPMRREWGYTAGDAERLFGSSVRRGHSRESILEGTYWDFRPLVTSDTLFAYQRDTKKLSWRYDPQDQVILNPTITLGGGRIYFLQVPAPQTEETGRIRIDKALDLEARLVALDAESGELVWEHAVDYAAIEHHLYALYQNPILVTVGSRNQATDEQDKGEQDKDEVWYDLHAYDANTGNLLWEQSQNNRTDAGGDHGEQDHHPVLVGNRLFVEPFAYDLQSGKPLPDWQWQRGHRHGCGTVSASANAFFFRDSNAAMFDLRDQTHSRVTQVSRPGCWINMIPAGGLLLVPEASSGCTCNFALQTSMAFRPVRAEPAHKSSSANKNERPQVAAPK